MLSGIHPATAHKDLSDRDLFRGNLNLRMKRKTNDTIFKIYKDLLCI